MQAIRDTDASPPSTTDGAAPEIVRSGTLDDTECLFLLRWNTVGRVAVGNFDEAPTVVPVSFVVDGDTIVFRFEPGPLLRELLHQPVTFEADGYDAGHRVGWTVQAQGLALEIDDDPDLEPAQEPWSPADGHVSVRLTPSSFRGHRFEAVDPGTDTRDYR
jgi:nitroimidazol reductase NimA-like FMN-containing flavoprotein (pyridoxamine 5'-phosphate oxidase superfamily)